MITNSRMEAFFESWKLEKSVYRSFSNLFMRVCVFVFKKKKSFCMRIEMIEKGDRL